MFIAQIIEFELRGIWPLAVHVPLQLVICTTKQKSLKQIFKWIKNFARGNVPNFSPPRLNHLQNFIPKCKIFK